jgi:subtilisin family serine protease
MIFQRIFCGCARFFVIFIAFSVTIFAAPPEGKGPNKPRFAEDTILVKPKRGVPLHVLERKHKEFTARVTRTFEFIDNVQVVKLPPGLSVEQAIERYQRSGLVEYATPNVIWQSFAVPSDPRFAEQWGLRNTGQVGGITLPDPTAGVAGADIKATAGWDVRTDTAPIIVAVTDTGVRYRHQDLKNNMWINPTEIANNGRDDDGNGIVDDVHGATFRNGDGTPTNGDPNDDDGHGTHVAGTIGAVGNNGVGVAGVAWKTRIMALNFIGPLGGFNADAIACIDYAISKGAKVINASWGGPDDDPSLRAAIARARDANIVFVAAAGNLSPFDNYGMSDDSFNWIDPGAHAILLDSSDAGDNFVFGIPLPFTFTYFDQDFTELIVFSNGLIGFDNQIFSSFSAQINNVGIPNSNTPNNMIAPHWAHMHLVNGTIRGTVRFRVIGSAPNRIAVISWVNMPHFDNNSASFTFQVLLFEGTNDIKFQYLEVSPDNQGVGAGRQATVGIEGPFGIVGRQFAFNGNPSLLQNNQAIRFSPGQRLNNDLAPQFPASYDLNNIIAVAATDRTDTLAAFSHFGPRSVHLGAPGVAILSTWNTSNSAYEFLDGTSMAAPHVAGAAALLYSRFPSESPASIINRILSNVDTIPSLHCKVRTGGRLNLHKALTGSITTSGSILVSGPNFVSQGKFGGPFSPASQTYTIINGGGKGVCWESRTGATWIEVVPPSGFIPAGGSMTATVQFNCDTRRLFAGSHQTTVVFTNITNGAGTTSRAVSLLVQPGLDPNGDADCDGIPNQWEIDNGFDPFNPADALEDEDGDGFTNLEEYLCGTDPNDPNDFCPSLSMRVSGNDVVLNWNSKTNRKYQVQYFMNSVPPVWTNLGSQLLGTGGLMQLMDPGAVTNNSGRAYRLKTSP